MKASDEKDILGLMYEMFADKFTKAIKAYYDGTVTLKEIETKFYEMFAYMNDDTWKRIETIIDITIFHCQLYAKKIQAIVIDDCIDGIALVILGNLAIDARLFGTDLEFQGINGRPTFKEQEEQE